MNERFEQMMLEATKDMPQGYYVPGEYFQKFAELIVRRVISVYNDSETFKTSVYDDNRVLDYFGIDK